VTTESILWRRLDVPGHDACRLERDGDGWRLDGAAVFFEEGVPAQLAYRVTCDADWRSREGTVRGWLGARSIDFRVQHTADGEWTLNGVAHPRLRGLVDLDLGFTPATNLFQIRRIALDVGAGADVPVAWLDPAAGTIDVLDQRYERRSESAYWYEGLRFDYAAMLDVDPAGFALRYPHLWEAER